MKKSLVLFSILAIFSVLLVGCKENVVGEATIPTTKNINAHSCNADDVCEVNELNAAEIEGEAIYSNVAEIGIINADKVKSEYLMVRGSDHLISLQTYADVNIEGERIMLKAEEIYSSLTGSGLAYACIDERGMIFRSEKPCR